MGSRSACIMASVLARQSLALALVVAAVSGGAAGSKLLNITNSCVHTVWPEISGASSAALDTTGFELAPGQWEIVPVPSGWSGRVWARTLCSSSTTGSSGKFSCVTGDCGSGNKQDCAAAGGPVTVAEFTLDGSGGMDLYDVSLVDGFNLPVMVAPQPQGGADPARGNCPPTGCMVDMNGVGACPPELRVTSGSGTVGCKSACQAFGSAEYCCTGEYGNPNTCKPSAYSELFKSACPLAFSYAYDDGADSIFTCGGGGDTTYAITFCPSTTRTGGVVERTQAGTQLDRSHAERGGGGGMGTAPSMGMPPPTAAAGLTTADKIGIAFVGGILTAFCVVGVYFFTVAVYRRYLQPQPEEEVVDDEELAPRGSSTTSTRGESIGSDDSLRTVIIHSSPSSPAGDEDSASSAEEHQFPGGFVVVPR